MRGGLVLGTWIVRLLPGESQRQTAGRRTACRLGGRVPRRLRALGCSWRSHVSRPDPTVNLGGRPRLPWGACSVSGPLWGHSEKTLGIFLHPVPPPEECARPHMP